MTRTSWRCAALMFGFRGASPARMPLLDLLPLSYRRLCCGFALVDRLRLSIFPVRNSSDSASQTLMHATLLPWVLSISANAAEPRSAPAALLGCRRRRRFLLIADPVGYPFPGVIIHAGTRHDESFREEWHKRSAPVRR